MKATSSGVSDVGRVRQRNEDAFLSDDELQLYVVCDGMGGHAAGDVASRAAADAAVDYVRKNWSPQSSIPPRTIREIATAARTCVAAVHHADARLRELSKSSEFAGLGTTITLLLVVADNAIVAHVGDSRLYHRHGDEVRQITSDHNLAAELVRTGYCSAKHFAQSRARHMLTRSLGQDDELVVDVLSFPVSADDYCLLCTDGFSNSLKTNDELRPLLTGRPNEIAPRLVGWANGKDGSDNVTALVVHFAQSTRDGKATDAGKARGGDEAADGGEANSGARIDGEPKATAF